MQKSTLQTRPRRRGLTLEESVEASAASNSPVIVLNKRPRTQTAKRRRAIARQAVLLLLPALAASGQYVGKVGQGIEKKPTLRATAVYEYTGSMQKPNASRLVPVVVWDGEHYQPGGLYLAQPEPLAVAPGTQYVLEQTGVPAGYFNIASAGELAGAWVGLGRFAPELPHVAPKKLAASKTLPRLSGGAGRGRADEDDENSDEPVLHRKAGSDSSASSSGSSSSSSSGSSSSDGPTLHRRDGTSSSSTTDSGSPAPPVDPDRPTLHRPPSSSSGAPSGPNDPDRPTLHRHAGTSEVETTAPDPDRPHLRYGRPAELGSALLPAELKEMPAGDVKVGEVVAVSDVSDDSEEPHNFRYTWPSATAESDAELQMHALALRALANSVQASFGPAAKENAALKQAADQAEAAVQAAAGPVASAAAGAKTVRTKQKTPARPVAPLPDPLSDVDFHAFQLSYGGGVTYVYTAHTLSPGATRRYVVVIAEPDFYGKPHAVLAQTTRADTLSETPALHLIDAVDTNGDHRAELLFSEQTVAGISADGPENSAAGRQFALYSVSAGEANEVYSTAPGVVQ